MEQSPCGLSARAKKLDWWYNPEKDKTGIIFTIGPLVSLTLGFAFWAVSNLTTNSLIAVPAKVGYVTNLVIVILNLIPIQAAGGFVWDGRKLLKWNRSFWITLAITVFVLIILDFLI